jgi:energy-coupling factor transporter ATP-binding protein EcfA2
MKLHSMTIKNFRAYKDEVLIEFNDLTMIIGRNDVGKSTILEALNLFFNDDPKCAPDTDMNVAARMLGDNPIEISIELECPDESVVLDETCPTSLREEYLLNQRGRLEIVKRYMKPNPDVFIRAFHPTHKKCCDLLLIKQKELRDRAKELGITEIGSANPPLRRAIRSLYADSLECRESEIPANDTNMKPLWSEIQKYLPIYALFRSDRRNTTSDEEVQDPLKLAVKVMLQDSVVRNKLDEIAALISDQLQKVANNTLQKLHEIDAQVADTLTTDLPTAEKMKWADVFKNVSIKTNDGVDFDMRGSGVKRMIVLSFFRAQAESALLQSDRNSIIYAIEEPETSQHYISIKTIVQSLKALSAKPMNQLIMTTHNTDVLREVDLDSVRLVAQGEGGKRIIRRIDHALYPSVHEISYLAYGRLSEEHHNELYGRLEDLGKLSKYCDHTATIPQMLYKRDKSEKNEHLSTYVRHQIHHPENQLNARFTTEQLRQSIEAMREFLSLSQS